MISFKAVETMVSLATSMLSHPSSDDLTYMNYKEIDKFIKEKIREYNSSYVEYSRAFASLKSIKSEKNQPLIIFNLLASDYETQSKVFDAYDYEFKPEPYISSSELLKKLILTDYGNLYNTAVAFTNLPLMYPAELNPLFEADKEAMKASLDKALEKDSCIASRCFSRPSRRFFLEPLLSSEPVNRG